MNKILLKLITCAMLLSACENFSNQQKGELPEVKTEVSVPVREHSILAVLWQQLSAEYKALCYQAFNVAQYQLDNILAEKKSKNKPLAIVTDIDETVLDNSPYNAKMIEQDKEYSKELWVEWGKEKSALPVPGAIDFLKYAESKGVEVFYISNRFDVQQPETLENLKNAGFPNADAAHILLKTESSAKEPRRKKVAETHEIVMLLGDNLSDFTEVFDGQSTKKRNELAESLKADFGKKFIVLPNPMYGDWETKGLYEGSYKWTANQKDSIRKAKLRSY